VTGDIRGEIVSSAPGCPLFRGEAPIRSDGFLQLLIEHLQVFVAFGLHDANYEK
jgi:hypothetical protein